MTYLTRRAHDYCGTYAVDGGVSTLPGRFGVFRTAVYASEEFLHGYLNELIFFGRVGPLNANEDKFHTRWLINHGWKIKLQANAESTLSTELGEWPKYNEQVLRWMRTTWRSNPRQLFNQKSWTRHSYTSLNLLMWFFRASLFQEGGMFLLLRGALKHANRLEYFQPAAAALVFWIVGLKILKLVPHLREHPTNTVYIPGYLAFGYWCSLVKIWALVTCWNASWGTATVVMDKQTQAERTEAHAGTKDKIMTAVLISSHSHGEAVGIAAPARTGPNSTATKLLLMQLMLL